MKTVTLPLEFVKEAHQSACDDWKKRIEEHVPELAEPQLEVGKWYKQIHEDGNIILSCYQGEGSYQYGFNARGIWSFQLGTAWIESDTCKVVTATKEEVEDALIKEAKKRGFKVGVVTECVSVPGGKENITDNNFRLSTINNNYRLSVGSNHGANWVCVFKNGKWAEIIKNPIPKSLQKAIDKLGKEKILEYLR